MNTGLCIGIAILFLGWLWCFLYRSELDLEVRYFGIFFMGLGVGIILSNPSYIFAPSPSKHIQVVKPEGEIVTMEVYKRIVYGNKSGKENIPE